MYVDTYNKSVSFLFHPVIADIYSFVNISFAYKLVNKIKLYHPLDRTCPDRTRPNGATST